MLHNDAVPWTELRSRILEKKEWDGIVISPGPGTPLVPSDVGVCAPLLAEAADGSVPFVVAANQAAQDAGIRASDLVTAVAGAVGGRGGGKADLAQGSGKDPSGIEAALAAIRAELARS